MYFLLFRSFFYLNNLFLKIINIYFDKEEKKKKNFFFLNPKMSYLIDLFCEN